MKMIRKLVEIAITIAMMLLGWMLFCASARIAEQHKHRERIVSSLYSVVFICSENGVPFYASDNSFDYFGWQPQEIITSGLSVIMPSLEMERKHDSSFKKFISAGKSSDGYSKAPKQRVIDVKCRDGSCRKCLLRMFAAVEGDRVFVYATVLPVDVIGGVVSELQQKES